MVSIIWPPKMEYYGVNMLIIDEIICYDLYMHSTSYFAIPYYHLVSVYRNRKKEFDLYQNDILIETDGTKRKLEEKIPPNYYKLGTKIQGPLYGKT